MYTQEELETKIRTLDSEISAAIESVTTDGTSTKVNLNAKKAERDRYLQMLQSQRSKRPPTARINIWGG
jgi:hypothetical protein